MENLKIRVNSEDESKEAQELFFELGYVWHDTKCKTQMRYVEPVYYSSFDDMELACDVSDVNYKHKEITLPELRDLVVLKRNDVGDATHENIVTGSKVLQMGNKNYYWQDGKWNEYPCGVDIKPIEKKEMKEYLIKIDGNYKYQKAYPLTAWKDWIEIPEGAECYAVNSGYHMFFTDIGLSPEWSVLWQRPSPPEELPFIDDEPSFEKHINTMKSLRMPCMPKPSLNDQYAEIEKVRQAQKGIDATLAERQTQYGCFEDVAHVTQGMIHLMRQCGYDNMPQPHQMALTMIASKMARIVNGDCNHLDSWHDISGYAKLVENIIGEPK